MLLHAGTLHEVIRHAVMLHAMILHAMTLHAMILQLMLCILAEQQMLMRYGSQLQTAEGEWDAAGTFVHY